jgi:flavodoxin
MKSIIIYYSYSGNTRKVAGILKDFLIGQSEVAIVELTAPNEPDGFLKQCKRAFWHARAQIMPVEFDLSKYDTACFGSPVWAFGPAPAINAYLDKCFGLEGKKVILFTTYGSGTGNRRCLNYMQRILSRKGVNIFKRFSVQQGRVKDKDLVLSQIKAIAYSTS